MSYALSAFSGYCSDPNAERSPWGITCVCKSGYTCADPPMVGSCKTCVATASSGAGSAAMRASCLATGGTWMSGGWCFRAGQSETPQADPSSSDDEDPGSGWDDSGSPSSSGGGGGGGSPWYGGGGGGDAAQAGMSTAVWFAVAVGVMAVGLFAYDATGAGAR